MLHLVMSGKCTYLENGLEDSKWREVCLDGPGEPGEIGKKCLCTPYEDRTFCPCLEVGTAKSTFVIEDSRGIVIDYVSCKSKGREEVDWVLEMANHIGVDEE